MKFIVRYMTSPFAVGSMDSKVFARRKTIKVSNKTTFICTYSSLVTGVLLGCF